MLITFPGYTVRMFVRTITKVYPSAYRRMLLYATISMRVHYARPEIECEANYTRKEVQQKH
jgi:hypothetical protein